jgi:hypothetical protein
MERLDPIGPPPSPIHVERMPAAARVGRDQGGSQQQRRAPARRRPAPPDEEPDELDDDDGGPHVDISA